MYHPQNQLHIVLILCKNPTNIYTSKILNTALTADQGTRQHEQTCVIKAKAWKEITAEQSGDVQTYLSQFSRRQLTP